MKIIINKTEYDNHAPYEIVDGETYCILNNYLMRLGFGCFNCNDLYIFWSDVSEKVGASWLEIPDNIEDFKNLLEEVYE